MVFVEGKHLSKRSDVGMMAKSLARYEYDAAGADQGDQVAHLELLDIWTMMEALALSIPLSERPTQAQLMVSVADQRQPIAGMVSKNALECRIAHFSC